MIDSKDKPIQYKEDATMTLAFHKLYEQGSPQELVDFITQLDLKLFVIGSILGYEFFNNTKFFYNVCFHPQITNRIKAKGGEWKTVVVQEAKVWPDWQVAEEFWKSNSTGEPQVLRPPHWEGYKHDKVYMQHY